jgi:hypothetical protein
MDIQKQKETSSRIVEGEKQNKLKIIAVLVKQLQEKEGLEFREAFEKVRVETLDSIMVGKVLINRNFTTEQDDDDLGIGNVTKTDYVCEEIIFPSGDTVVLDFRDLSNDEGEIDLNEIKSQIKEMLLPPTSLSAEQIEILEEAIK